MSLACFLVDMFPLLMTKKVNGSRRPDLPDLPQSANLSCRGTNKHRYTARIDAERDSLPRAPRGPTERPDPYRFLNPSVMVRRGTGVSAYFPSTACASAFPFRGCIGASAYHREYRGGGAAYRRKAMFTTRFPTTQVDNADENMVEDRRMSVESWRVGI